MRARDALRMAKRFVAQKYPEHQGDYVEVCRDGSRVPWCWSFGVHIDEEDPRYDKEGDNSLTGYVFYDFFTGKPVVSGLT